VIGHFVKVDVLVSPLEVMDDSFVGQLLFDNENVLEKVDYSFLDVKVIELRYHGLLILQIALILVDQCISFINHVSNVIKYCAVSATIEGC